MSVVGSRTEETAGVSVAAEGGVWNANWLEGGLTAGWAGAESFTAGWAGVESCVGCIGGGPWLTEGGGSVECVRMFVAEEGRRSVEVMAYSG